MTNISYVGQSYLRYGVTKNNVRNVHAHNRRIGQEDQSVCVEMGCFFFRRGGRVHRQRYLSDPSVVDKSNYPTTSCSPLQHDPFLLKKHSRVCPLLAFVPSTLFKLSFFSSVHHKDQDNMICLRSTYTETNFLYEKSFILFLFFYIRLCNSK